MPSLLSLSKGRIVFALLLCVLSFNACHRRSNQITETSADIPEEVKEHFLAIPVDTIQTLSSTKIRLTKAYAKEHYGLSSYTIHEPKIVVIHYTVIPTLEQTLKLFKQDRISSSRTNIKGFSSLNVGIHYVIDRDGSIYNLLPDSIMARHLIGFNHVSIGIENIAKDESELTKDQLESNAQLVRFLSERHPSIRYIIGHDEYNDTSLAHYQLFKALDSTYLPYDKQDPGPQFMNNLRAKLKEEHALVFEK